MNNKNRLLAELGLVLLLFVFKGSLSAQVFVNSIANGLNDGSSWGNAYTNLQEALQLHPGEEIWVATGVYKPVDCDPCNDSDRRQFFNLAPDTRLYGGFIGNEININQRDIPNNPSILSGDIGVPIDSLDNSFRVMIAENATANTILDGFIIEEANANGSRDVITGGGLYLDGNTQGAGGGIADIQVRNCVFSNNYAGSGGAGIAIDCSFGGSSSAIIEDCLFEGNTSAFRVVSSGGAILIRGDSQGNLEPIIRNSIFRSNSCGSDGGAIAMTHGGGPGTRLGTLIENCEFSFNRAGKLGGAIWYQTRIEGDGSVMIRDSEFTQNSSGIQGGAIFIINSSENTSNDTLLNCVFAQNESDGSGEANSGDGGAVFISTSLNAVYNQQIINCLFDRNMANGLGGGLWASANQISAGELNVDIINSTFYGNQAASNTGPSIHFQGGQGLLQAQLLNSIAWNDSNTGEEEISIDEASIFIANTNVSGSIPSTALLGPQNTTLNPQFVDPINGDFNLSNCSPLIDAGNNAFIPLDINDINNNGNNTEVYPFDLNAQDRIVNQVVDLGALEFAEQQTQVTFEIEGKLGICQDSVSILDAGSFATYAWSNGDTTQTITVGDAGMYSVTVVDANGCQGSDTVIVEDIPTPLPEIIGPSGVCIGGTTELSVADTFATYLWSTGETSSSITIDQPGAYLVTVTNGGQCQGAAGILMGEDEALNASIFGITQVCPDSSTVLLVGQFSAYQWSTGDTTRRIEVNQPGSYSVTVTNDRACSVSDTIVVESLPTPEISILGSPTLCPGSSIQLNASAEFNTYLWSTGESDDNIIISTAGNYGLTVTDGTGCPASTTFEVMESDTILPIITPSGLLCQDSIITLDAGPFSSFLWSTGDTSRQLSISTPGNYAVSVNDVNGCGGTNTLNIEASPNLEPAILGSTSICPGSSSLLTTNDVFDNYRWSTGSLQTAIEVDQEGTYAITVSNDNSCPGIAQIDIRFSDSLEVDLPANIVFCEGESTTLNAGMFSSYLWSTGDTTQTIEIMSGGTYSITVSNADGCEGSGLTSLSQIPFPDAIIGGDTIICPNGSTLLSVNDDFDSYLWSNGSQSPTTEIGMAGTFQVTLTNGSVCSQTLSISVKELILTNAETGSDFSICSVDTMLSANLPIGASGLWTHLGGVAINDSQNPNPNITGLEDGDNLFTWTLSTPECPNYSSADLIISKGFTPIAFSDEIRLQGNDPKTTTIDLAANDDFNPNITPTLNILSSPSIGTIDNQNGTSISFSVPNASAGQSSFSYEICDALCINLCSQASVNIDVDFSEEIVGVPNGITPNGDGQNESFIFDLIEQNGADFYPDNRLIVFNRWGNIVYEQRDYDNSWQGSNQNGEELPDGTYYYILYLNIEDQLILKGDVTIIR